MLFHTNRAFLKRLNDRTELTGEECERFLRRKSLLKKIDAWGRSALTLALEEGHLKLASALIERGADINIVVKKRSVLLLESTQEGNTPLSLAVRKGYMDITALLIERGVNINNVTKYGDTALSLAIENGHTHVAKF